MPLARIPSISGVMVVRRFGWFRIVIEAPSTCRPKIAEGGMLSALRGRRGAGDLIPDRKRGGPRGPILGGGEVIAAEMEEVVDLVMSREEPLRLTG
jgi:hypothetical protein